MDYGLKGRGTIRQYDVVAASRFLGLGLRAGLSPTTRARDSSPSPNPNPNPGDHHERPRLQPREGARPRGGGECCHLTRGELGVRVRVELGVRVRYGDRGKERGFMSNK